MPVESLIFSLLRRRPNSLPFCVQRMKRPPLPYQAGETKMRLKNSLACQRERLTNKFYWSEIPPPWNLILSLVANFFFLFLSFSLSIFEKVEIHALETRETEAELIFLEIR